MIDDPYLDVDVDPWILKNVPGHRDRAALQHAEDEFASDRIARLDAAPLHGEYDWRLLADIHRWIFDGIYSWAGERRSVGIAKDGGAFTPAQQLPRQLDEFFDELTRVEHRDDHGSFIADIAYLYERLNHLHPFREGNGRAQRAFWELYCIDQGRPVDWTRLDKAENDAACAAGGRGDLRPLRAMFDRLID
jgi:cell filamentation protein